MQHWMTYVKHSYEVILAAEAAACVNLDPDIEAFTVHMFARHMENPNINNEPIAIKLMEAMNTDGETKKTNLTRLAEECILIDGLKLNRKRWPSLSYYVDMGQLALGYRTYSERPPELFYDRVAREFTTITKVIGNCRV
jgi:hypothetical protein